MKRKVQAVCDGNGAARVESSVIMRGERRERARAKDAREERTENGDRWREERRWKMQRREKWRMGGTLSAEE